MMRRREFILGLCGATAASWAILPMGARAQQGKRVRQIGVLLDGNENDAQYRRQIATFTQELVKSGWMDGHNVGIAYRFGGGDASHIHTNVSELVHAIPDVIVATGSEATRALKQQTGTIPIVFISVTDPVASGFVASFARPGANITGFTSEEPSIASKWLAILKEIAPDIATAVVLYYPENPNWQEHLRTIEAAAPAIGMTISAAPVTNASEIARRIEASAQKPNAGLIVVPSGLTTINREMIAGLAARHRLPAVYAHTYFATSGGLVSYGSNNNDLFRRAAEYVDRILRGTKPADLPVQAPTKFELAINLKAAKALGLTVPNSLLVSADEVIE
jgi:putative tryptophan/tyrosine transport system substrate-binding protein